MDDHVDGRQVEDQRREVDEHPDDADDQEEGRLGRLHPLGRLAAVLLPRRLARPQLPDPQPEEDRRNDGLDPIAVNTVRDYREVLKNVIDQDDKAVTIETIQKRVAEHFDVRLADMTSKRRPANIAFPRQIAMYLARELTKKFEEWLRGPASTLAADLRQRPRKGEFVVVIACDGS